MNNIDSKVYADISIIINMMPDEMRQKISKGFINFIENNKDINYSSSINPNIPINKQNISKETKEILGIIYRDYLCDKQKQIELLNKEQDELKSYAEKQRELYNPDNIFKKVDKDRTPNTEALENNNNTALIEYKESFFTKLKNYIFKILHINK